MSFASKVLYTGDASTTDFTVTMPYISSTHIKVYVNEILQLTNFDYNWSGASTISFETAPNLDDAIEIQRHTSPTEILVDFVNGSVLNESDLDTAYLHNYYLTQEYADSFNEVINAALVRVATSQGIESTDPDEVVLDLVADMLDSANAANLQARISDIDDNAEAIITLGEALQVQINTLASGVAAAVWIQPEAPVPGVGGVPNPIPEGSRWYDSDDNNHPYIYQSSSWYDIDDPRIGNNAAAITVLQTDTGDNAAAIVTEQTARTNADTAIASELHLIGAQNVGQTAFIIDLDTAYVGAAESLASRFATISADWAASDDTHQAAAEAAAAVYTDAEITTEQTARANADSAAATTVSLLDARVVLNEGLVPGIATNAAAIVTEAGVAADATSAVAHTVTALTTTVGTNTSSAAANLSAINGIQAEYGVTLNVNGYVSGFKLINTGSGSSAFTILADKFAIVDASGDPAETEYVPFEISGGKINLRGDVKIDGDLLVTGTVNGVDALSTTEAHRLGSTHIGANAIYSTHIAADEVKAVNIEANAVTAGKINVTNLEAVSTATGDLSVDGDLTMGTTSAILGGQTAYNTGDGYFLGYSSGDYVFSIGDGGDNSLTWDGSTLTVKGNLEVGTYTADAGSYILEANTQRNHLGGEAGMPDWTEEKRFIMGAPGQVYVRWEDTRQSHPGTQEDSAMVRYKVNGVVKATTYPTASWSSPRSYLQTVANGDIVTIEITGGTYYNGEFYGISCSVRNAKIGATFAVTDQGTVVTD